MNRFLNEYVGLAVVLLLAFVGLSTLLLVGWVVVGSWIQERIAEVRDEWMARFGGVRS